MISSKYPGKRCGYILDECWLKNRTKAYSVENHLGVWYFYGFM